jgi:L-aminopeptidase/D-esterase-like protein
VLATDAPLSDALLRGLAKRAGLGLSRSGSTGGNSSGDIFLAFSVADPMPEPQQLAPIVTRHSLNREEMNPVYEAAIQAVDESVINAIVQGEDVPCFKPEGETCPWIHTEELRRIMARHLRLTESS